MSSRVYITFVTCLLFLVITFIFPSVFTFAQQTVDDENIIARYKQILLQKPKEGSTFDRLYHFYLEGAGLDVMLRDYQGDAEANPNDPNLQLILGHLYKRLGKDAEAITSYQRAVELAPNNYYTHFALGQLYKTTRKHEDAVKALGKAAKLSELSQNVPPDELISIYRALGHAYFHRDNVDKAILAWQKIAELDPQDIFARVELADLFREQELYDQAITQHEEIINFKKDDPYRVCLSHREIGNLLEEKGEIQDAIKRFDTALELTAQGNWLRKDIQHRIIGIFAAESDWKGLIKYYQEKLEKTPNDTELLGLLAAAYIENQQVDEGINTYRKGIELAPTNADLRMNIIASFRNDEKFAEAAAEYEILSKQNPKDIGIYRELGELYHQLGNREKAKQVYQRMIDHSPDNPSTHLILAEIYTGHDWIDEAITQYEKAISLVPNNLDYVEYFGDFFLRQGNREKALETWNRMVADEKAIAVNYDRLAQLLKTKKFKDEAISAIRKAVELLPEDYRYRETLGKYLMENGEFDQAITEYTSAMNLAPNDFFADKMNDKVIELYRRQATLTDEITALETELDKTSLSETDRFTHLKQLTKMYLKMGNVSYAMEVLLKAKQILPNDVTINRWLADIYYRQGRLDSANATYQHLISIDSANAREYHTKIAKSYLNVLDFQSAIDTAKQVIANSPRNPDGHQLLAQIAVQTEKYDSAIDSLKNAIRLRPEDIKTRSELAKVYLLAEKPQHAIAQYWRCWNISDNINDKLSLIKPLSVIYEDLGKPDEFVAQLKKLAKSNTSWVAAILALSELQRMKGDLTNARFQLAQALNKQRENPPILYHLVQICLEQDDIKEALTYQQQLVKVQPNSENLQKLGELLFNVGREQEAIQVWTKLLHAKNQTLEAEVKLAALLLRNGLQDEAFIVLERAAEKITGTDAHLPLYQLGSMLVTINEPERAIPYFHGILEMSGPSDNITEIDTSQTKLNTMKINRGYFTVSRRTISDIQRKRMSGSTSRTRWRPKSIEDAKVGALVHLTTIAQQQGRLNELVQQLQEVADENPNDVNAHETLARLYNLIQHHEKADKVIEKLVDITQNDSTYLPLRIQSILDENLSPEQFKKTIDALPTITSEERLQYIAEYAESLYRKGDEDEAIKLLSEMEDVNVSDYDAIYALFSAFIVADKIDMAKKYLVNLSLPQPSKYYDYSYQFEDLIKIYLGKDQLEDAIDLTLVFLKKTKPISVNTSRVSALKPSSSSSGSSSIQTSFPPFSAYYDEERLNFLKEVFGELWIGGHTEFFYTELKELKNAAKEQDRIYPSLALAYCYWWTRKHEDAINIINTLQNEFPDDLNIKHNAALLYIHTNNINKALNIVEELAQVDTKNKIKHYDLMAQLATRAGETETLNKLIPKVLSSQFKAEDLLQLSYTLQEGGYYQYAIAIAQKAKSLVMTQRNTHLLEDIAYQLASLGRGQEAAQLKKRAFQFSKTATSSQRTRSTRNISQAANPNRTSQDNENIERKLVEDAKNKPNSFHAQLKLAEHYERINQIEKATKAYKDALALRPKDNSTRLQYIRMLENNGQAIDAIPDYTILLKSDSNALDYEHDKAIDAFVEAGKLDELISITNAIIMPVGQYAGSDFSVIVARRCLTENRTEDAIKLFEKVIQTHPSWTSLHQELASMYVKVGETEKAVQFLIDKQKNERSSISDTGLIIKIAEIYDLSDQYDKAVQYLKEKINAQEQLQSTIPLVLKLADIYMKNEELQKLITEYETKHAEDPTDTNLLYLLTSMKLKTDDKEGIKVLVDKVIDNVKTSFSTEWLYELSDACRDNDLQDLQFRLLYATAEKLEHNNSWQLEKCYQKLAEEYVKIGEIEKSQNAMRKMGKVKKNSSGWGRILDKRKLVTAYMQYQMWDEALKLNSEIINSLDASYWERNRAQEKYIEIKQRRGDLDTDFDKKIQLMSLDMQRAYAQEFEYDDQFDKAIQIYDHIIKTVPEDYESHANLAQLYTLIGQHEKSHQIWTKLLKIDPDNTNFQDGIVNSLQSADKLNDAYALAQEYVQEDPELGVHYLRLAKLYADDNKIDDAIINYKKSDELAPGNRNTYLSLADLYLRTDNFVDAENAFNNALQLTTSSYQRENIEEQILNLYRYQGKIEDKFQDSEAKGTLTSDMQAQRARHYLNIGDQEKSVNAFKKAINMTSDQYEKDRLTNELLGAYVEHDQTELAIDLYEKIANRADTRRRISYGTTSITVTSNAKRARDTFIRIYKNQNKLERLKAIFEEKLKKSPNNVAFLETFASIQWESEDYKKAAEVYQTLYNVQPNNILSYYYAAAATHKSGHPVKAEKILNDAEQAFASSPEKDDMWMVGQIASICLQNGMTDVAYKHAKTALEMSRGYSSTIQETLWGMLGEIYKNKKQYEDAVNMYRQIAITTDYDYDRRNAESEIREITLEGKLYEKWIPKQLETVKNQPDNINARLQLAENYELAKKHKQAVEQYEAIRELQPNNPKWYKKLADLYNNLPDDRQETGEVIEGTALSLDGNGSYVDINDSEMLNNLTDQVTVSTWFKCTEYPKAYSPIISKTDTWFTEFRSRTFFVNLKYDGTVEFAASPNGEGHVSLFPSNYVVRPNTWIHIAGVVDTKNDTIKLIVDGNEIAESGFKGVNEIFTSKIPLRIGWTHEEMSLYNHVNGFIDEVRVWNIARTTDDIRADMNKQLNGDEPGLVGYWKFDTQQDGKIFDSSPNKIHGTLIGNAKLEKYTRPIYKSTRHDNLAKSKAYYEKTLKLENASYQNYDQLAKLHLKVNNKADAEAVYLRALEAPLTQSNYESAVKAVSELYADEGQEQALLAILEQIKHKLPRSAEFHDQLVNLYKKTGDIEKSDEALAKWVKIRQNYVNKRQSASYYRTFAEQLLDKEIFPEIALMNAKLAVHNYTGTSYTNTTVLGEACVANGQVDEALRHFKQALSYISSNYGYDWFWEKVAAAIKKVENKEVFIQRLDELIHTIPSTSWASRANAYRYIAQFLNKNDTRENIENYIITKVGFVPESRWITLGPFKNIDTMGTLYAYIPEETTQIDPTAKYNGRDGLISWKKSKYRLLDGHYNFVPENDDWSAAYVWTIVNSPKDQDIVLRFDSDDQGLVWLNGKEVFRHYRTSGVRIDRYTIPVTLKQGENTILLKISNASQSWDFYLRLTDEDGNPIQGLTYQTQDELLSAPPPAPTYHVNLHLGMADYYYKNNMPEKAMEEMKQTGTIHEYSWHILGPFDNKNNVGYDTAYIPDDITEIDFDAKYEGVNGDVKWTRHTDDFFDGYVDLGRNVNSSISYAWVTVNSPDEREVQFRFGCDDLGKVWLNGTEVLTKDHYSWAIVDDMVTHVKLKQGKNTILVKVGNAEGSWGFFFRITDFDGKPFPDLNISDLPDN